MVMKFDVVQALIRDTDRLFDHSVATLTVWGLPDIRASTSPSLQPYSQDHSRGKSNLSSGLITLRLCRYRRCAFPCTADYACNYLKKSNAETTLFMQSRKINKQLGFKKLQLYIEFNINCYDVSLWFVRGERSLDREPVWSVQTKASSAGAHQGAPLKGLQYL